MLRSIRKSVKQQSKLIAFIAIAFAASILGGMAIATWGPESIASWLIQKDTAGYQQVEKVFGPFREAVRTGDLRAMAICTLIVFGVNTLGSILRSISTIFVLPLAFLLFNGLLIGASLMNLQGSSFLSVFLFLLVVGFEWVTYVLGAAAGTNVGLAVVLPARVDCSSRREAFNRAIGQAGSLYVLIVAILAVQAVFEILYVRKVLLMGGTGIPLAPW